jgi:bisphosphoglycerate-independent phosphoglycerate mutase (AlkP superfamily)
MNNEEPTIKKVSSFADAWWKILTIVGALIFGIYNLSTVWITISETKKELEDFKSSTIKDNTFRDDRSDKRYERATLMYEELKKHGLEMESEMTKHEIESAYFRGKTDAKLEILLKK